ncbi:MAG: hypothetical protein Hyperionvirus3_130 [Hyperionvirus sp.]|uniref:Ankyrin repeat protein n=1 Tax=Hyperionvirus sp. TaxID=2487770 RepID=A0A3G5A919_9VIRU|nr:MAG: hypothetical protein Hyperionvirus3_130 [Hyperionvirus sp.]
MSEINCKDGCIQVEKLLNDEKYDDRSDAEDANFDKLCKFKCYNSIREGDYGDMNYAVAAYAVEKGHLGCLQTLHKKYDLMWHADLAEVAIENNQFECLQYIMEHMGDVNCCRESLTNSNINDKCKEYIKRICRNCKVEMHPKKIEI